MIRLVTGRLITAPQGGKCELSRRSHWDHAGSPGGNAGVQTDFQAVML